MYVCVTRYVRKLVYKYICDLDPPAQMIFLGILTSRYFSILSGWLSFVAPPRHVMSACPCHYVCDLQFLLTLSAVSNPQLTYLATIHNPRGLGNTRAIKILTMSRADQELCIHIHSGAVRGCDIPL